LVQSAKKEIKQADKTLKQAAKNVKANVGNPAAKAQLAQAKKQAVAAFNKLNQIKKQDQTKTPAVKKLPTKFVPNYKLHPK